MGSSPYKTSGILSMIPHLEMGLGTFFSERRNEINYK